MGDHDMPDWATCLTYLVMDVCDELMLEWAHYPF